MKILLIGGTMFVGKHCVEQLLAHGHEVTIFHRGKHPVTHDGVQEIHGDRDGGLDALQGKWDAVIDTCGYIPRVVRASCEHLKDKATQYVFVSTVSVYKDFSSGTITEESERQTIDTPDTETVDGTTYGPLKALCEDAVTSIFDANGCIVRPGLIVGPDDYTDRFTYWVRRIAEGGEILVPDDPRAVVQWIDVRDLAGFIVTLLEKKQGGTYNAVGPEKSIMFNEYIAECVREFHSDAHIVPVPYTFLKEENIAPWSDIPFWVPSEDDMGGMLRVLPDHSIQAGMRLRPLRETLHDTRTWDLARGDVTFRAGITREKEKELLEKWNNKSKMT